MSSSPHSLLALSQTIFPIQRNPPKDKTSNMPTTKPPTGMQTRAMARKALADITPAAESGAEEILPDTTAANELELKKHRRAWDSPCKSRNCPIKHPHTYGLRPLQPQPFAAPITIWQDTDAAITEDDDGHPDSQPPPLIAAMINTLRMDPLIVIHYPNFTDVLRDFYCAHGGRSDKYHGPTGMFGLGMDLNGHEESGLYPYHKHPDEGIGGWFAFEESE